MHVTYPLFFGLDISDTTPAAPQARSSLKATLIADEKRALKWAALGLGFRVVSDILDASGTAILGTTPAPGIPQAEYVSQIAVLPLEVINALTGTPGGETSIHDPASDPYCRNHQPRLQEGGWIACEEGQAARVVCVYPGGGGTACARAHILDPRSGRLISASEDTPLISLPACQPLSTRCAEWEWSENHAELSSWTVTDAPCRTDQLAVKWPLTTWQRKPTPRLHQLSVRVTKGILTARQWKLPRIMAPMSTDSKGRTTLEGCLDRCASLEGCLDRCAGASQGGCAQLPSNRPRAH